MNRRWLVLALLLLLVGCQKRGAAAVREAKERAEKEEAEQAKVTETTPADGRPRLRGCTVEGVQQTVRSKLEGIKRCYRKVLTKNREAAGKLVVEIQIDKTGRAKFLGVQKDEIGDEDFTRCVFAVLKPLPFPIPETEPCIVVYPFALSAGPKTR